MIGVLELMTDWKKNVVKLERAYKMMPYHRSKTAFAYE
jgi:hypothetical protein